MSNELDNELVKQLRRQFFEECVDLFSTAENSLMKMEKAGKPEHLKEFMRCLHSIKGSSRAVGFDVLTQFAHHLETLVGRANRQIDFNFFLQAIDLMMRHVKLLEQNRIPEANQVFRLIEKK